MKQRPVALHVNTASVLSAESIAAASALALSATGVLPWWAMLSIGVLLGALLFLLQIADAPVWEWIVRGWRRLRGGKPRRLAIGGVVPVQDATVELPDKSTRTVPYPALAEAITKVLGGATILQAYRDAGVPVPAVGASLGVGASSGSLSVGDIGQFADHQVLALGEGKVWNARGQIADLADVDTAGPEFLGWFHPPVPGVPVDIDDGDGGVVGVLVDGTTLVTTIAVWGRPLRPTVLYPQRAQTPNVLPVTAIAENMQRYGLCVDVDVVSEGSRTSGDSYAVQFDKSIGSRAAAGVRTNTLVVRLDIDQFDTVEGLVWRRSTADAVVAATRRIAVAAERSGCRMKILDAAGFEDAAVAAVGGATEVSTPIEDGWNELRQPGRGYLTSFYFSAEDVAADKLDEMWSFVADAARPITHTTVVLALRRRDGKVRASAMLRVTSTQPLPAAPAPYLNRAVGWQWDALQDTIVGARRLRDLPSTEVTDDLDNAIAVGPSGILLGGIGRDALLLMPLSDPAAPTQTNMYTDNDLTVRQLIRRAAAAGLRVAVYDSGRRWAMTATSPLIWSTSNFAMQPPWPPTLVVHNGRSNPYPGAWASVAVAAPRALPAPDEDGKIALEADIELDVDQRQTILRTERFGTQLTPVAFRNEQTYLN
ncbi:type VII secretion protein EccE [Mycobacteroides abscessus subsp. abscessus]|uniref:type VII secretion protein EccE n=1 Tax=Mycobacteroides abscessus TaxID=36809 RepID=UPI0009CD6BF2|nr:type VII secretion protein EccE [Mycobacteroides abscessus]SLJ66812.1 type VII secretion protein EccE [Mycobacteroides abscessus subsp. abscessus]